MYHAWNKGVSVRLAEDEMKSPKWPSRYHSTSFLTNQVEDQQQFRYFAVRDLRRTKNTQVYRNEFIGFKSSRVSDYACLSLFLNWARPVKSHFVAFLFLNFHPRLCGFFEENHVFTKYQMCDVSKYFLALAQQITREGRGQSLCVTTEWSSTVISEIGKPKKRLFIKPRHSWYEIST